MTSSPRRPRIARTLCSPSAQRTASATLLLPEPFGPQRTETPGSNANVVDPAKLLKPTRSSRLRCIDEESGARSRGPERPHALRPWLLTPGSFQARQRLGGRGLLGELLARPLCDRLDAATSPDLDRKDGTVSEPTYVEHLVHGGHAVACLAGLLEPRLGIQDGSIRPAGHLARREALHQRPRGPKSAVDVDGPDDRFERAGEQRIALAARPAALTAADLDERSKLERPGPRSQGRGAH